MFILGSKQLSVSKSILFLVNLLVRIMTSNRPGEFIKLSRYEILHSIIFIKFVSLLCPFTGMRQLLLQISDNIVITYSFHKKQFDKSVSKIIVKKFKIDEDDDDDDDDDNAYGLYGLMSKY